MKQALLVIDVQNEYFSGHLPVTYPLDSLQNILKVMDHAKTCSIPVILIQHSNPPDAPAFARNSEGWRLHDAVAGRGGDLLIEKKLPGSFTGTGLEEYIRSQGIDTLVISGYMTQMCCDTTARQAFHRGYTVIFLSDATGTLSISNDAGSVTDQDLHTAILVTQAMRFSTVMTTNAWIEQNP
jgi:nicotinamidase-related amidase